MRNKHKYLEFIMAVIMLILVYVCAGRLPAMQVESNRTEEEEEEKKIILLDAGHGGCDPGKISVTGTHEKDINLAIAIRTKKKLESAGYTVLMTREKDEGLYQESDSNKKIADMKNRCRMVEESHANLFISIHQNSYTSEGIKGAQVFYYSGSVEGKALAEAIQKKMKEFVDESNGRMAKENDSYYLLLHVSCPAVIAECGFLSNYAEAALLEEENYQEKIAEAICQGVEEYFKKNEKKTCRKYLIGSIMESHIIGVI